MLDKTKLWTALVTPMNADGTINHDDLASLIHRQDEAKNGVLLLGSTGEGLALALEEKQQVVRTAAGLNVDIPLMVGVGGFNLKQQLKWIQYCQEFDIDCFLLVTPLYAKPGARGQFEWFRTLLNASDKPCLIYNIPSRTGTKLHPEVLKELRDHKNLYGIKESSGSIEEYQQYRALAPELKFLSGDDILTPFFAVAGCDGLLSVASNVWPKATHAYCLGCLNGEGKALLKVWRSPIEALFSVSNPVPVKALLKEKGWIASDELRPPLTAEELEDKEELLQADSTIRTWYRKESKIGTH